MKSESFCYWLQGFFEISGADKLDATQIATIKKHLNLVFAHDIDPKAGDQQVQDELNKIHSGFDPHAKIRC